MEISNLTFQTPKRKVLQNISIKLHLQGINWIFGPNGAGKSSLLTFICGLDNRFSGSINQNWFLPGSPRVGFLINEGSYFDHLTIRDNLSLYENHFEISPFRIQEFLDQWDLVSLYREKIANLSQGQRTRFCMALAMVHDPHLLVLDEPETSLDFLGIKALDHCFDDWRRSNKLIVISSHYPRNIVKWDHMTVLQSGRLIYFGSIESFISDYQVDDQEYLKQLHALMKESL